MAYCLSCGRNSDTHNGLCAQCASEFDVARKRYAVINGRPVRLTLEWIASNANRYPTNMAAAFLAAVQDAMDDGRA